MDDFGFGMVEKVNVHISAHMSIEKKKMNMGNINRNVFLLYIVDVVIATRELAASAHNQLASLECYSLLLFDPSHIC